MVEADLKRWADYQNGNSFPWDAPNYPGDIRLIKRHVEKGENSYLLLNLCLREMNWSI